MSCNSCGLYGFGRSNRKAKMAMNIHHGKKIPLSDAWKIVKRSNKKRKSKGKKSKKARSGHKKRTTRRGRRSFGSCAITDGPGYTGLTSYSQNVSAPYFGDNQPWNNPPEFYLPVTNGVIQSPPMLTKQ